jgi:hypothetical protein
MAEQAMTFDVEQRAAANRRRLTRNTVRAATGVATLIVAAALIAHAHRHQQPAATDAASHPSAAIGPAAVTANSTGVNRPTPPSEPVGSGAFVAPARRVVLPTGSSHVDGYPVAFPHTAEGAAAMAVALGRYVATLDYATADEVTHLYMDPALTNDAATAAAALVRGERAQLGATTTGPVPPGYAISSDSFGVQWRQVMADVYDVTVIGWTDTTGKDGHLRQVVAGLTRVKWFAGPGTNGGDWKAIHATGGAAPAGLGEIGRKAFNDNGYAVIEKAQP